jgi:hypothetical protein
MMTLLELAERCEQAGEGSRDLSDRIAEGAGYREDNERSPHRWWFNPQGREFIGYPPDYSRSLDAAMTLVPEGHVMFVANTGVEDRSKPDFGRCSAIVGPPETTGTGYSTGATPALALCAAAIRARSTLSNVSLDG